MLLCYIDESGTPESSGNTSHFVLAGLSFPDEFWKYHHAELEQVKQKHELQNAEIHTGSMLREYREQKSIPGFGSLTFSERRKEVTRLRTQNLKKAKQQGTKKYNQVLRNFRNTNNYIHLSRVERQQAVLEIANLLSNWDVVRLFAECIDKSFFDPSKARRTLGELAFEQIVSRFEYFLKENQAPTPHYGLIFHDNNQTVARRHKELMKSFITRGTFWNQVDYIIETPIFVDSELTDMIQLADLCAYAIRRYVEKSEDVLFNLVFQRAQRRGRKVVSVRHFTEHSCNCTICKSHRSV